MLTPRCGRRLASRFMSSFLLLPVPVAILRLLLNLAFTSITKVGKKNKTILKKPKRRKNKIKLRNQKSPIRRLIQAYQKD